MNEPTLPRIDAAHKMYIIRGKTMKKLLLSALILGTAVFVVPSSAEAATTSTTAAVADPQIRVQIGGNRNRWRRARTVISTRYTRVGRYRYRETIRTTYMPNGRVRRQVISRVRVGGYGSGYGYVR